MTIAYKNNKIVYDFKDKLKELFELSNDNDFNELDDVIKYNELVNEIGILQDKIIDKINK